MNDFASFTSTHPALWTRIGEAWTSGAAERYAGLREAVCLVGMFPESLFDAEVQKAFGG